MLMLFRIEGFGLIGLEALLVGFFVFVSKNLGFGEALRVVLVGLLCVIDFEEFLVWVEVIKKVWKKDRGIRFREVKLLRFFYDDKYSWVM